MVRSFRKFHYKVSLILTTILIVGTMNKIFHNSLIVVVFHKLLELLNVANWLEVILYMLQHRQIIWGEDMNG